MAALSVEHPDSLAEASRHLIERLAPRPWAADCYLAGSAALALYLAHRPVAGLDLMTGFNRLAGPERRDLLEDLLAVEPETEVETARDGYLYVRAGEVRLRFFYYPYPLIDPTGELAGLEVASAVDLGLMKLGAIISRGTRRDFVDLYLLCRHLGGDGAGLGLLLERAPEKFGHVRDFPLQALKGLADLSLVDGEPMPRLREELSWQQVEGWLTGPVRRLGRRHVGLDPEAGAEAREEVTR